MSDLLDSWRRRTDDEIEATLSAMHTAIGAAVPEADEIVAPLQRYAEGGKRLRAMLLLASHEAHGREPDGSAFALAAALELFQTAALLHDDVLDDSDTRRGGPAAHRAISSLHADRGWLGSSEGFGAAGAILAGDLALMACQRAVGSAATKGHGAPLADMFADMADLVTAGQYADMRAAAQPLEDLPAQESQIRAVMRAKTASYSAEYPLALGAAAAGATKDEVLLMRAGGRALGVAFQLRDDVLGLVGAPETTGKPAGDDIREGKRTVLIWHAWTTGTDKARSRIEAAFGRRDAADAQVADAVDVVVASGALTRAEDEIAELTAQARETLAGARLAPRGAAMIDELVTRVVKRNA